MDFYRFYGYSMTIKWYFQLNVGLNLLSGVLWEINTYSIHNTFFTKTPRVCFIWFTVRWASKLGYSKFLEYAVTSQEMTSDVVCEPQTIRRYFWTGSAMYSTHQVFPESYNNHASLEEVMHVGGIIVLWWIYSVLVYCVMYNFSSGLLRYRIVPRHLHCYLWSSSGLVSFPISRCLLLGSFCSFSLRLKLI